MRYYPAPPPTSLDPAAIQRYLSDELRKIGQLIFDVEAGAWTAAIRGSGTAGTYQISSQTCRYTRIGRRVFIDVGIVMAGTVTGGGTGYL